MNKTIYMRIAAIVAVAFSILTVIEGAQVLLGISQPDYVVLTPLLIYNFIMGIAGILVGVILWINYAKALRYTVIVTAAHLTVLLIIGSIFMSDGNVSQHSIQAMTIRLMVWLTITGTVWKTSKSEMSGSKVYLNS